MVDHLSSGYKIKQFAPKHTVDYSRKQPFGNRRNHPGSQEFHRGQCFSAYGGAVPQHSARGLSSTWEGPHLPLITCTSQPAGKLGGEEQLCATHWSNI